MISKIKVEGNAEILSNDLACVCMFCGDHNRDGGTVEFNFREKKIFYLCPKCNKMNELFFGQQPKPPIPRTRIG